jgi:cytochrome c biogenesis protein CcmG, thiol:disulfide interchange protein DsbE
MTTTKAPPKSSNRLFMLVVAAIIIAGLAGVAFLANGRPSAVAGEPTGTVTVDGEALSVMPPQTQVTDASNDPSYGVVAPTLTGTGFDDKEITIKADGRPKAVYFVAHWCPHCQAEVPLVQELIDEGQKPDNLDIYAVSTSVDATRGNYPPQVWLKTNVKFSSPVIRDDDVSHALVAFGGGGFPFVVYLDADNKVLARSAGEMGKDAIAALWAQTAAATSTG